MLKQKKRRRNTGDATFTKKGKGTTRKRSGIKSHKDKRDTLLLED